MSVRHRKNETKAIQQDLERLRAAGESSAALLSMAFRAQIAADRASGANAIDDRMILASAELVDYPVWSVGVSYKVGEILRSGDHLYEVVAAHTSNAAYPIQTTFAYYRHVELVAAGTRDDPIPYPEGTGIVVNVKNGLYYSYKGKVYLAKLDMPNCVWTPDTVGLWQWEEVKGG